MTRRRVSRLLTIYWIVLWSAVVFRVDRFPLTWAPMYSSWGPKSTVRTRIVDQDVLRQGFEVTRHDGTRDRIGTRDLNIPKWNMFRLYYRRAFGQAPAKYNDGNQGLGALNRWLRGLGPDEPRFHSDWQRRLFWSVNQTLEQEPGDPGFVVRMDAHQERLYYDLRTHRLVERKLDRVSLECDDRCRAMWREPTRWAQPVSWSEQL